MEEYPSAIYFERKSLNDLFGTFSSKERQDRFKREIDRSKEMNAKLIIAVEATDQEIMNGHAYSKRHGSEILKTLDTYWLRYDVPYILCANRAMMVWRMVNLWESFFKNWRPKGI